MSGLAAGTQVGIVRGLWRYPVKSMAAESLEQTDVSWSGLAGDRRWAFVRPGSDRNGFPWHTIRETSAMCRYIALLTHPERPDKSPVQVRTPTGASYAVTDPSLAEELGPGVRVMRMDRGLFDALPVSLITTESVSALCSLADVPGDELRFRPNLVVVPSSGQPFDEDEWVGHVLTVGTARVRVDRRDPRCVIVNVDPEAGRPNSDLLKVIGRHRQACAGVYGTTVRPGSISVGDPVTISP